MRNKFLGLVFLITITYVSIYAQDIEPKNPGKLEKLVQKTIAKCFSSSVLIDEFDPITKAKKNRAFSGVVVSEDGLILCVAHAITPNVNYMIKFPDGKEVPAHGLGRIQQLDAAMLKIDSAGKWPFAAMGYSEQVSKNEPCVSIAYPASLYERLPVIRFGYVANLAGSRIPKFRTTCLMEPGDSGGPVFDLDGRVIGLHSSILVGLQDNFEVPISVYRKYWNALLKPINYIKEPEEVTPINDKSLEKGLPYRVIPDLINPGIKETSEHFSRFNVELINKNDIPVAMGILIKFNRQNLILSKNSLIKDDVRGLTNDGSKISLSILSRNEDRDLILFRVDTSADLKGIEMYTSKKDVDKSNLLGKFLVSPAPQKRTNFSIYGSSPIKLKGLGLVAYLGAVTDEKLIVQMVQENAPAAIFGLRAGDEILDVDGRKVETQEQFTRAIQAYKPKAQVSIKFKRDGLVQVNKITLANRLDIVSNNDLSEKFLYGKSERRDGFANVFVHDAQLKPVECGGGVFDLDGNLMGMNIARFSRTSSLAIPASELLNFLEVQSTK